MDVLTDVLGALELKVKGQITARRTLVPPWRYNFAAGQDMIFHLLSSDSGYLSRRRSNASANRGWRRPALPFWARSFDLR